MKKSISIPQSVTIRYLQLILPILLILFIFLAGTIYYLDSSNQIRMNQEFSQKMLDQANKTLKTWIDDQMVVLTMIVNDSRVIEACANPTNLDAVVRANDFLRSFHERNGFYENIALSANLSPDFSFELMAVDGKRHIINRGVFFADSSKGASIGKSNTEHPMAKSIYNDGKPNVITHVYRSLIYGNPAFIISLPVYKDGNFVGAAHVAMPMKHFTDKFVNEVKMGQSGYMFMVDDKGLLISHPNKEFILNEEVAKQYNSVISRILNGERYFEQYIDDSDKTYSVIKFDFHGRNYVSDWYLVFVQNKGEVLSSSIRFIWLISGFLVIGFLLIIGVVYLSTVKLLNIGFRDALTGLYNRNYLEQEILQISTGRYNPVGFISIDVDGLKLVNDNLGHGAGDTLLITVGQIIKKCFHHNDSVVRLGGDEFAVLMPVSDVTSVQEACQRLYEQIVEYNMKNSTIPVSISIGWSVGNLSSDNSIYDFIEEADKLMYIEKKGNRLKYVALFKEWLEQYGQNYKKIKLHPQNCD
ncbi:MAG: rpfC 2 [Firmicutes bacterium]|nr:rpfC 2 [Bacillota bacterium]